MGRTNLQSGYKLREGDEEKIKIEKELELLIEDDREEGEDIVLLIPHNVWWISFLETICRRYSYSKTCSSKIAVCGTPGGRRGMVRDLSFVEDLLFREIVDRCILLAQIKRSRNSQVYL